VRHRELAVAAHPRDRVTVNFVAVRQEREIIIRHSVSRIGRELPLRDDFRKMSALSGNCRRKKKRSVARRNFFRAIHGGVSLVLVRRRARSR
jgi:hypothetical protein